MSNDRDKVTFKYLSKRFGFKNLSLSFHGNYSDVVVFDGSKKRVYRSFHDLFGLRFYLRIK